MAPAIAEQVGVQRMGPKIYRKAKLTLKSHLNSVHCGEVGVGFAQEILGWISPQIQRRGGRKFTRFVFSTK